MITTEPSSLIASSPEIDSSSSNANFTNNDKPMIGSYVRSNLWEIRASFKHYRCESYAHRIQMRMSASSSCIVASSLPVNVICENAQDASNTQPNSISAPSSPKSPRSNDDNPDHPHSATCPHPANPLKHKRIYDAHHSGSASSLSGILKRITRLRRPSSKPCVFTDFDHQEENRDSRSKSNSRERSKSSCEHSIAIESSPNDSKQRSKSETKFHSMIVPTRQKSFPELKSILKIGGLKKKKTKNEETSHLSFDDKIIGQKSSSSSKLSPKRLSHPPQSLSLKDRIVVIHNQELALKVVQVTKMTSSESIGTCSLDVNNDNNVVSNGAQRSVSERSLKSVVLLEESPTNSKKSPSSLPLLKNGHVPSYVGISCAISGYTGYSKYCSSIRSNTSQENSPTLKTSITPLSTHSPIHPQPVTFPVTMNLSRECHSGASPFDKAQFDKVQRGDRETKVILTGENDSHGESQLDDSQLTDASIVQKRIASLYGESFAAGWRESRGKQKFKQLNINTPKYDIHETQLANDDQVDAQLDKMKSPPVFRHLTKDFLEQLETANEESIGSISQEQNSSHSIQSVKVEVPCASTAESDFPSPMAVESLASASALSETSNVTVKDGRWYLTELNKTTDEIKERVAETESILEQESEQIGEDVSGKLRSAIGKANLLMNKKLNQFRELCIKNIEMSSGEQFETTNDDLAGFWDMVYIQVIDVKETFEEIKEMKKNNWRTIEKETTPKTSTPIKSRIRKPAFSSPSKTSPAKSSSDKSSSDDSSSRDVERRNKLKEAKRKQAQLMAAKSDENNITIYTPPNHKEES